MKRISTGSAVNALRDNLFANAATMYAGKIVMDSLTRNCLINDSFKPLFTPKIVKCILERISSISNILCDECPRFFRLTSRCLLLRSSGKICSCRYNTPLCPTLRSYCLL
ncbi:hypothetical protein PsorP6_002196 [Peronosclerospora sorghi]|uniref:Uncharacterized protein n=1 Tax=Peronosclerospora sorghi TaxID=230839 RepID=A0ACC0WWA8_9STRA|nr:hypothetical protein PsorP6_002196 [Peronosclerospora sorghi]